MIDFYTAQSSNGHRVAIMLEECGFPYRVHKLDLMKGEQKTAQFLAINPLGAIPAIVDGDGPGGAPLRLAQSGAITLYLAEKAGKFLPRDPARRAQALQWMMTTLTDCAPASMAVFLLSNMTPDKSPANVTFFEQRTLQFLRAADARLAEREWLADELSVADFALFPVYLVRKPIVEAAGGLANLGRWGDALMARPAVAKALKAAA